VSELAGMSAHRTSDGPDLPQTHYLPAPRRKWVCALVSLAGVALLTIGVAGMVASVQQITADRAAGLQNSSGDSVGPLCALVAIAGAILLIGGMWSLVSAVRAARRLRRNPL
jgi:hypothetical protein